MPANLFLRKVPDLHRESYRVVLKDEDGETGLGSISVTATTGGQSRWRWGIDTVIPMRDQESGGYGADRKDCQQLSRPPGRSSLQILRAWWSSCG